LKQITSSKFKEKQFLHLVTVVNQRMNDLHAQPNSNNVTPRSLFKYVLTAALVSSICNDDVTTPWQGERTINKIGSRLNQIRRNPVEFEIFKGKAAVLCAKPPAQLQVCGGTLLCVTLCNNNLWSQWTRMNSTIKKSNDHVSKHEIFYRLIRALNIMPTV